MLKKQVLTVAGQIQLKGDEKQKKETLTRIAEALRVLLEVTIVKEAGQEWVTYSPFTSVELSDDGVLNLSIVEKTID